MKINHYALDKQNKRVLKSPIESEDKDMERIVIETDLDTKEKLKMLAFKEKKTMKELLAEAIRKVLIRLK